MQAVDDLGGTVDGATALARHGERRAPVARAEDCAALGEDAVDGVFSEWSDAGATAAK